MRRLFILMAVIEMLCLGVIVKAVNIETVYVGDARNKADTQLMSDGTSGYGSVGYNYYIGKYEVTAEQYTDFLNNKAETDTYGLYNNQMWSPLGCRIQQNGVSGSYTYSVASDYANRPVNYVSYWDACRFANWLHNGQGSGDTETGAYNLNGYNGVDGRNIQRNTGWTWAVPTEDEWYKAAYYKLGGTNVGYWLYPTQSDIAPSNVGSDGYVDPGNHANFSIALLEYTIGSPYYRTNVGEFENSMSAYGTFDQGGNVLEWNESIIQEDLNYAYRGMRGGSFQLFYGQIQAGSRLKWRNYATEGVYDIGFRVVQVVPTYTLSSTVNLGDFAGPAEGVPVAIELLTKDGMSILHTENTTLDAECKFHLENVEPGTYKVGIKPSHWLRKVTGPVTVGNDDMEFVIQ